MLNKLAGDGGGGGKRGQHCGGGERACFGQRLCVDEKRMEGDTV
jgi:hypothetical protein